MAVTVTETVGGATSNAYDSVANVDAYLEGRQNASSWENSDADQKNRAVVEATRTLDLMKWRGVRASSTQALAWPRDYVPLYDPPITDGGTYYLTTEIPDQVKQAMAELALEFRRAGTTDIAGIDSKRNVKRKKIDVLETEYADASDRVEGLQRFPRVVSLIAHFLDPAGSGVMNVVRV